MKYFFLIISLLLSTALIGQKTTWNHNGKVQIKSDGSMVVDDSTFVVDGTNNKVGIGTLAPTVGSALTVSGRISQIGLGNSTFVGFEAGKDDDLSGNSNVAIGYQASYSNLTASYNVANGYQALYTNLSGAYNTAIGYQALYSNSGRNNAANGYKSLYFNTSGFHNTAIGSQAGSYIADKTTAATITNNSVFLGYRTSPLADDETNQIVIGYDATGIGSNSVVLGNDNIVTTILKGNVGIGTPSPSAKLDILDASSAKMKISNSATNYTEFRQIPTQLRINEISQTGISSIDVNPIASDGSGQQYFRLFRESNSTGNTYLAIYKGDNTTTVNALIGGNGVDTYFAANNGNVGIGNTSPTEKLDVNGELRVRTIGSGTYNNAVNMEADGTLTTATSDKRLKRNISEIDKAEALDKILQLKPSKFQWKGTEKIERDSALINELKSKIDSIPTNIFKNKDQKRINEIEADSLNIDSLLQVELDSLYQLKKSDEANKNLKESWKQELKDYRNTNRKRKENQERFNYGLIAQEVEEVLPDAVGEADDGYKFLRENQIYTLMIGAIQQLEKKVAELEARVQILENE